ncbi:MAG: BrnT family toxin [Halobacteriovoraceae bacterium]|nr:BrnT family toxin [Halobacteriovoraceae bacterium]
MAKFVFVEWLLLWLREHRSFIFEWDSGNQSKSENKHGIKTTSIEEVFKSGLAMPLGVQVAPEVDEERLGIIGPDLKGNLLHVVFTIREGRVRPISGRPAHKKERKQYGELLRKISERI